MRIKINNDYKCFMSIPNVNYWYDDEGRKLFIGWLWWGIDIIFKGYDSQPYKCPFCDGVMIWQGEGNASSIDINADETAVSSNYICEKCGRHFEVIKPND